MSQWINALEAVLPTGEIVRTGSAVLSDRWCTNSPLPDVTGLFVNFQGTTGIVTKMSVQLWHNPKYRKRVFILSYDIDHSFSLIKGLTKEEVCDDIAGLSWPLGKMIFGEKKPVFRGSGEPLIFIWTLQEISRKSLTQN